ncbi:MAG: hypothetical protein Q9188_001380 [Gyalolechia gomerana]
MRVASSGGFESSRNGLGMERYRFYAVKYCKVGGTLNRDRAPISQQRISEDDTCWSFLDHSPAPFDDLFKSQAAKSLLQKPLLQSLSKATVLLALASKVESGLYVVGIVSLAAAVIANAVGRERWSFGFTWLAFTILLLANTILTILVVGIMAGADEEGGFILKAGERALPLSWAAVVGCLVAGAFDLMTFGQTSTNPVHGSARKRAAKEARDR